jgi:hypothetical protein
VEASIIIEVSIGASDCFGDMIAAIMRRERFVSDAMPHCV